MKNKYIYTLIILAVSLSLASCLKDDDDNNVTLYGDTAIASFSLSKVNRTITTTSSKGTDSTYTTSLSTLPVFSIDQYQHTIYNTKPLPSGCDLKHILANITAKNSGVITIKSMTSDSLYSYISTDSLDFSEERVIRVFATNGSAYRDYTVTVNMSSQDDGDILWEQVTTESEEVPEALLSDVILTTGEAGSFRLSKDNGNTWTEEQAGDDEDTSLLPTGTITWVTFPYSTSKNTDYELMAGTNENREDGYVFWRKIVEHESGAEPARWVYMPTESHRLYQLPKMDCLSLIWFEDGLYAIGDNGKVYKSTDYAITWRTTSDISLPQALKSNHIKAATSASGALWIRDIDNDELWKGTK